MAVHAHSVFDGLRLASLRGPFDLAVLGLMMPVPATLGLVREMRTLLPGTPVAVLARVPDPAGSIGAEADAWIVKDAPTQKIVDRLGACSRAASGRRCRAGLARVSLTHPNGLVFGNLSAEFGRTPSARSSENGTRPKF